MSRVSQPTLEADEHLVAELHRLGISHLARLKIDPEHKPMPPAALIAALAGHSAARIQGALIPLYLRRPDLQPYLVQALERLDRPAAFNLQLYYQAAVYLQRELAPVLVSKLDRYSVLPDLFSAALGLPTADTIPAGHLTAQPALNALGEQHQRHSDRHYNWAGSYRQHIPWLIKHLGPDHTSSD